mgnify:CR=1 FL=1
MIVSASTPWSRYFCDDAGERCDAAGPARRVAAPAGGHEVCGLVAAVPTRRTQVVEREQGVVLDAGSAPRAGESVAEVDRKALLRPYPVVPVPSVASQSILVNRGELAVRSKVAYAKPSRSWSTMMMLTCVVSSLRCLMCVRIRSSLVSEPTGGIVRAVNRSILALSCWGLVSAGLSGGQELAAPVSTSSRSLDCGPTLWAAAPLTWNVLSRDRNRLGDGIQIRLSAFRGLRLGRSFSSRLGLGLLIAAGRILSRGDWPPLPW